RLEPARIVDARGANADELRPRRAAGVQRRAAARAEFAPDEVAAVGGLLENGRLALRQLQRAARHDDRRRIGAAAGELAIAAMAIHHAQRRRGAFVPDRAASAAAGEGHVHSNLRFASRTTLRVLSSASATTLR